MWQYLQPHQPCGFTVFAKERSNLSIALGSIRCHREIISVHLKPYELLLPCGKGCFEIVLFYTKGRLVGGAEKLVF